MTKTFVFGVGAQKSGTSWLYEAIAAHPKSHMGILKEYHIWDAKFSPLCANFRIRPRSLLRPDKNKYLRYAMQNIDGFYEWYFKRITSNSFEITGDITPSYAVLTEPQLAEIAGRLHESGFRVKVVFLMRDPVERCWSAVRMNLRLANRSNKSDLEELKMVYNSETVEFRTRYELVAERLDRVFATDDIFYGIFEELFTEREMERLSKFLGIDIHEDMKFRKINVSPKNVSIDTKLKNEIMTFYRDTYHYCYDRFPQTKVFWNTF